MEIKLTDLWSILKKFFLLILAVALLFAVAAGYITKRWMQEEYTTQGMYMLEPKNVDITNVEKVNQDTIVASRVMANLDAIMQTEGVAKSMLRYIEEMHELDEKNPNYILDHTYTASQLLRMIDFKLPPDDGGYLITATVVITAYSAHDTEVLLLAFSAICNEHVPKHFRASYTLNPLFEEPRKGTKTAPNMTGNLCVGFLLGALLAYGLALLLRLVNHHVYRAEDLSESFEGVPLLGQVPQIRGEKRKGKRSVKSAAIKE